MNVFYAPSTDQGFAVLGDEESRHCVKVLRMRPGEEVFLTDGKGEKFIAHCREGEKHGLLQDCPPGRDVLVLIGPEGDFTAEEIDLALGRGYRPVSMGPHRLRT